VSFVVLSTMTGRPFSITAPGCFAAFSLLLVASGNAQTSQPADAFQAQLKQYCATCHNDRLKTAGVTFDALNLHDIHDNAALLERVLRKVKTGQMPPAGMPHPDAGRRAEFAKWLETSLDADAVAHPNPGHPGVHRLNRVEYSNAIRDIFALDVNPGSELPVDDSGYGFDNIGDVLSVSSALLDRYLSVGRKVARLAVGDPAIKPSEEVFEPRHELNRGVAAAAPVRAEWMSDDLPFNSAGGLSVSYYFPLDADYVIRIRQGVANAPSNPAPLELRLSLKAGPHTLGVTYPKESLKVEDAAPANLRQAAFVSGMRPEASSAGMDVRVDGVRVKRFPPDPQHRPAPLLDVSIQGPYDATGSGDTPSREKIFVCHPASKAEEAGCARKILANLARHAYRRPVTDADVEPLVEFYQSAREKGDFEFGIEKAIQAMLVSPDFLFRVESDPSAGSARDGVHRISDVELASRLSFFLWSSIPDDTLLDLAEKSKLSNPTVLAREVERMLDDPKSSALASNFAGQWLQIRNLVNMRPDPVVFADFDESLRSSMQRETELFFESILRENRSILDLLTANYTYLNERLALHYGIPNIYGSQFRRVTLTDPHRAGLLGEAGILTVTSPPNRTSVVERGKWILDNLLGEPPAPPPPNVPPLDATTKGSRKLTLREAMELHRANPACAGCHKNMDPLGFALENYDGIGEWRSTDGGSPIDASGQLPDGTKFDGPGGLREVLATARREQFVSTVTGKLLTYGLGRGVEYYDMPAVRAIMHQTEASQYRLRDLIMAIVTSEPFQMRRSAD
jgi:mono/diheme cytochrome c family protein